MILYRPDASVLTPSHFGVGDAVLLLLLLLLAAASHNVGGGSSAVL
jgi:hypothetical protein